MKFISTESTIAFIGLGVMGRSMAANLIDAGFKLRIHTRSVSKAQSLVERGAILCDTPADCVKGADAAITIVGYPEDVRQVYLGEQGLISAAEAGTLLIDMTTSQPGLALEIAAKAGEFELHAIDAPVSGGDIGARNGTLSIMCGGSEEAFENARLIFEALGSQIVLQGPAGSGQHTKMTNQIAIASGMIGICEALLYARRAGLDPHVVLESIGSGAAGSWSLSNLYPRIVAGNFDPGFFVNHFIKDMGIAIDEANKMGLALPGLAMAHQLYLAVKAQGDGWMGTHALQKAIASLSGIDWTSR